MHAPRQSPSKVNRGGWGKPQAPDVPVKDLVLADGLRVVDGLVIKEYRQGGWHTLHVATLRDLSEYSTVKD